MNKLFLEQVSEASKRWSTREAERERNLRLISDKKFFGIDSPDRVEKFLARHQVDPSVSAAVMRGEVVIPPSFPEVSPEESIARKLERILGTDDLLERSFLDHCLRVARTVGRVWVAVSGGRASGFGTGLLVSPRLLMTNNHVIESGSIAASSQIEFDFESTASGSLPTSLFNLRPDQFFFTDKHLDYTIVAVETSATNGKSLAEYGWNPLIAAEGKAIISQFINIIQHPGGGMKRYGLRENQIIDMLDDFIHYRTDTARGSSGSGLFNDAWELVGLHHAGVWRTNEAGEILAKNGNPWRESMGDDQIDWIANEGARISRVIAHLRAQSMDEAESELFAEAFTEPPLQAGEEGLPVAPRALGRKAIAHGAFSFRLDVADDGAIDVRLKPGGEDEKPKGPSAQPPAQPLPPSPPIPAETPKPESREEILGAAFAEWTTRNDVVNVRWGYVFKDGWISNEHALVVTVKEFKSLDELSAESISPLPDTFHGYPVQVTTPTLDEVVMLEKGAAAIESLMPQQEVLRDEITYQPPSSGGRLRRIENEKMRVVAHLSPDAGWEQLSHFIAGAKDTMTIGMYDFGSTHIIEALKKTGRKQSFDKMKLVLQKGESLGSGTKRYDIKDTESVDRLEDALGTKFDNAWVRIGRVNGWVAYSYHIKVAVSDHKAFWLSSGNWQSSNQPEAKPLREQPQDSKWLEKYNREWHTIVEYEGLAKVFEKHLLNDYNKNRTYNPFERLEAADLLVSEEFLLPDPVERLDEFEYFEPFDQDREFTVTPLLTPDNYLDGIIELIEGAEDELLVQNQTFNAPKDSQPSLKRLMMAIRDKQQAGLRVYIIMRVFHSSSTRKNLEALKDFGIDTDNIKLMKTCHTKGVIVDREKVVIGSHNWSNAGITTNRDASLLFEDKPMAEYYREVFWHDWHKLSRRQINRGRGRVELVTEEAGAPAGMTKMSWKEVLETM